MLFVVVRLVAGTTVLFGLAERVSAGLFYSDAVCRNPRAGHSGVVSDEIYQDQYSWLRFCVEATLQAKAAEWAGATQ